MQTQYLLYVVYFQFFTYQCLPSILCGHSQFLMHSLQTEQALLPVEWPTTKDSWPARALTETVYNDFTIYEIAISKWFQLHLDLFNLLPSERETVLSKITPELSIQCPSSVPDKSGAWPKKAGILTQLFLCLHFQVFSLHLGFLLL